MNPYLEITGTITEEDELNPGQLARFTYARVAPGLGNLPGDGTYNRQRRRVVPQVNPRTPAQLANRQKLTNAVAAWRALTQEEKSAWQTAGAKRALPGYNAFVSAYLRT